MSRGRRAATALAAVSMLLASPGAALAGAGEGVGYRLTGEPNSTLTRGFIRLPASPGAQVSAQFIAVNSTTRSVTVNFYGADGETTRSTGAVFGSSAPADAGTWITPSRNSAVLAPKSELPIDVTVRVPEGAGVGDHVGAVIMEQVEGASSATVTQVVRYAVPLLVDIAGGPGAQLSLGTARLSRIPGTEIAAVVMPMTNTGSRICRPVVTANVAGNNSAPMSTERQLDEILPGDRILYPLRMTGDMEAGTYLVRADVTGCGAPVSTSSSATLESSESTPGTSPPSSGSDAGDDSYIVPVPLKRDRTRASGRDRGAGSAGTGSGTNNPPPAESDENATAAPVVPRKPTPRSWLRRAGDAFIDNAPEVLAKASVPLGASALVGLLFFFQNALDRRDPKLVAASRERDSALRFDPNPLHS